MPLQKPYIWHTKPRFKELPRNWKQVGEVPEDSFLKKFLVYFFTLFVGGAGRFREALIIYIHVLHDLQSALKYCTSVKPDKHGLVNSWETLGYRFYHFDLGCRHVFIYIFLYLLSVCT